MHSTSTRRHILAGLTTTGLAALLDARRASSEEAPLDTTTVRFSKSPGICNAPQFVAEDLLRADGFSDFRYVDAVAGLTATAMLARSEVDFVVEFGPLWPPQIDQGAPLKILTGVHVGCYELFAHEGINSVLDLKGKTVGAGQICGSDPHVFVTAMATHVGLDPLKDINWVTSDVNPMELFTQRKIDAFLRFPARAARTARPQDRPCHCQQHPGPPLVPVFLLHAGHQCGLCRRTIQRPPRGLCALSSRRMICASRSPSGWPRFLVDGGYTKRYDPALQALREISYAKWRDHDPEDTIRFFSLRLREGGMIKSSPQKIIANGTDWRFLNEIKRELKT